MHQSKVEWSDLIWNPITGCSRLCRDEHGRIYCFAYWFSKRLAGRCGYDKDKPFKLTFRPERLLEPERRRKPAKIFTCSMGELFDPLVRTHWIDLIFRVMRQCKQHTFQVLTKQPARLYGWPVPENCWTGVSVDGLYATTKMITALKKSSDAKIKFVSFEPLIANVEDLDLKGIQWVIIGARTGSHASQPEKEWVTPIIDQATEHDIPIFMKDNLEWQEHIQQFPEVTA